MVRTAVFLMCLCALVSIPGCFGGDETPGSTTPIDGGDDGGGDADPVDAVIIHTDDSGLADVLDENGDPLFEVEVCDSLGNPLSAVEVSYLASTPYDVVCFVDSASGNAMGMFELIPEGGPRQARSMRTGSKALNSGVFILSMLDPSIGRLYDPERDGFAPGRSTTLQSIRRVMSFEDLTTIFEMCASVTFVRDRTKAEIVQIFGNNSARIFDRYTMDPSGGADFIISQRVSRLLSFSAGQHDSYRYREYRVRLRTNGTNFFVPLGVQASVAIDCPVDGSTLTDPDDQLQIVSGRINRPPDILTSDGGHVELLGNGTRIAGDLSVGGDGTGEGALFSTEGEVQLAEGENTLQVIAYVSEVNQGFENGTDGQAGQATITVHYEPEEVVPTAPTLSSFSHPTVFGGPDGQFSVSFHYNDPDGDVALAWEHVTYFLLGQGGEATGSASVYEHDDFACLRSTDGDCELHMSYTGLTEHDWFLWDFWVEDSTGLSSNHLEMTIALTSGRPVAGEITRVRLDGVVISPVEP